MNTFSSLRRPQLLLAIAICGAGLLALPTQARAFFGCSDNTALLSGAIDSVAHQTGRRVIVLNKKGAVVTTTCANFDAHGKPIVGAKGHIYVNNLRTGELYPEIKQTLADGKTRAFGATGPDGQTFKKTITAVRDARSRVIGAVLVITPIKG